MTCAQEIAAADDACEADPKADACKTALRTLSQCLQPCRQTHRTALAECASGTRQCITACPDRQPLPISSKDPTCVAACKTTANECRQMARSDGKTCYEQCAPLAQTARAECTTRPPLTDCLEALQQLRECTAPCQEALIDAKDTCRESNQACVLACPDLNPS